MFARPALALPLALMLAPVLNACHSSSDAGASPGAAPASAQPAPAQPAPAQPARPYSSNKCSMTLSGPLSGTFDCSVNANAGVKPNLIVIQAPKSGMFSAMIRLPQGLKAGSWTERDSAMDAEISMTQLSVGAWGAGKATKGTDVTLSLASASPDPGVSVVYRVSGSLDATLVNTSNAHAPPLKVHVSF